MSILSTLMENFSHSQNIELNLDDEIILGSSEPKVSQAIRRAVKSGKLRKLSARIYTSNLMDEPADIIHRHRYFIISHLFPNAVISHRSALEGGFAKDNSIVLTYKYTKNISLPGMLIGLIKGHEAINGDTPFLDSLSISSRARALLENLQTSRAGKGLLPRTLNIKEIEAKLDKLIRIYGENELNQLRDQTKMISKQLALENEFCCLDKMIGALLGTRKAHKLQSNQGIARAMGKPYDSYRLELFSTLANYLTSTLLPKKASTLETSISRKNFAFFEAYFSNFIEGTEFEIEEANNIIFHGQIIPNRSNDSHDILGTYKIVSSNTQMRKRPETADEFMYLLKSRHALLLEARSEQLPGQFKDKVNRTGNTVFVKPDEVIGTLEKGFDLYLSLEPGIKRAMYIMFLVTEVHPFLDGNGRIARVMMNAELAGVDECRIIIPTVYREDYLLTIRRLSRQEDPQAYIHMLEHAQLFSAGIDFSNYQIALKVFQHCNAFARPSEAKLIMPN